MPWQQHVADVALELNPDGSLVYDEADLVVGRQEGKTELKFVIAVTRLTAMTRTHGPQVVTYTMQDRKAARKRLEQVYINRLKAAAGFTYIDPQSRKRPTRQTEWRPGMNSGTEHIQFGVDSYLQIDTPKESGGHGDTIDLGMIDEAFAHEDATVENNMVPAMLARRDAQLWVLSAAGTGRSKFLYRKILAGRKLIEEGADSGTCYFEWSADDDADPSDPAVWRSCCPAMGLGFTDITEEKIEALYLKALREGTDALDKFRRSYLSQWPEIPVLDDGGDRWAVVGKEQWFDCYRKHHKPAGQRRYALDVDVNAKREQWASIGMSDGTHVELVTPLDVGSGVGWVVPACVKRKDEIGELLVAKDSRAAALVDDLEAAGVTVRKVKSDEFVQASMQIIEACTQGTLRHIDQPALNRAVAGAATKDVGDGQRKLSRTLASADIGPFCAVAMAKWAAAQDEPVPGFYE